MTPAVHYPRIPAPEKVKVHGPAALTLRDREVMAAVIEHGDYAHAADVLGIGVQTVKNHMRETREKLDCDSTVQAAVIFDRWMREQGAVE